MALKIKYFLSDEDCVSSILKIKENVKKVLFIEIQKFVVVFSKYLQKKPRTNSKFSTIVIIW